MFVRVLSLRNNYSECLKKYFMKKRGMVCTKSEVWECEGLTGQDECGGIRISRTDCSLENSMNY